MVGRRSSATVALRLALALALALRMVGRRSPATVALRLALALACGSLLAGCGGGGADNSITLYSGQHPQLTQALARAFESQTGIHVRVRSDDGIVLADEIMQDGSGSPADVYLTENSPELMALAEHRLLARLPASITAQIPGRYDSPTGDWVGVALRVSALTYDPSRVSAAQLPASILALADPRWKGKVAIAPTDSDFVPLLGAVIARYGVSRAQSWLAGLKANAALYQNIEAVAAAVDRGQAGVGIINQYYWYRLRREQGARGTHSRLYYFPRGDIGAIENVSGAAVLASSRHTPAAERFVAFLVSPAAQRILAAGDDYEYPARPGVPANPVLTPLSAVKPALLSVVSLGNDLQAASLLRRSGLT
jgi:iron(III) transport system substrate-binding protein